MTHPAGPRAIEAVGLTRYFGDFPALRDASLTIESGERLAIFGANGAGKTTLLRILATLMTPTAGSLRVFGLDPGRAPAAVRRHIGVVGHRTYLDENLTAEENLRFYARLYDVPDVEARIDEMLDLVGLALRRRALAGTLSRGQQQRLALARALLHDPDLLLLDEPDTGLDAAGLEMLAGSLDRPGQPRTVVLSSHHPERAARLAQRALQLVGGRIVADGPTLAAAEPALAGAR